MNWKRKTDHDFYPGNPLGFFQSLKAGLSALFKQAGIKIFYGIFILVFFAIKLNASTIEEGNTFLKNGEWEKAIAQYEDLVHEGYIGFELFFNLGTAYSKKGDVGRAIFNFEKALRIKPLDEFTRQQLIELNIKLPDKPPIYDDTGIMALIKKIQFSLPVNGWALLSVFLMFLVPLAIFISYKFQHFRYKKLVFMSSVCWFLLSGISILMARNCYYYKYLHTEAVILDESIKVFGQPDVNSSILFNLHLGTKVEISDSTGQMYYIRYAEKNGWVVQQDVHKIEL